MAPDYLIDCHWQILRFILSVVLDQQWTRNSIFIIRIHHHGVLLCVESFHGHWLSAWFFGLPSYGPQLCPRNSTTWHKLQQLLHRIITFLTKPITRMIPILKNRNNNTQHTKKKKKPCFVIIGMESMGTPLPNSSPRPSSIARTILLVNHSCYHHLSGILLLHHPKIPDSNSPGGPRWPRKSCAFPNRNGLWIQTMLLDGRRASCIYPFTSINMDQP